MANFSLPKTRRRLRRRNLVWIGAIIVLVSGLLYGLSVLILTQSYAALEQENAEDTTRIILEAIDQELWQLQVFASAWSQEASTRQFVNDQNPDYAETRWDENAFVEHRLSLVVMFNETGELLLTRVYLEDGGAVNTFSLDEVNAYLVEYARLARYVIDDPSAYHSGILVVPDAAELNLGSAILFAVAPVEGAGGTTDGMLMVGRFQTATELSTIVEVADVDTHFFYADAADLAPEARQAYARLDQPGAIITRALDDDVFSAFTVLNDLTGRPSLLLQVDTPRDISTQGRMTINFFLLVAIASGLGIAVVVFLWQEFDVRARVSSTSSAIRQIEQSGDLDARVPVVPHDELAPLAESVNDLLATLRETTHERARARDEYTRRIIEERDLTRLLIDSLPERVYIKDTLGRFVVANDAVARLHGLPRAKALIGKTDFDLFPPDLAQARFDEEQALLRGEIDIIDQELPITRASDPLLTQERWAWMVKRPLHAPDGQITGLVGIVRDITARKTMEDALQRAHDELEQRVAERTAELQREIVDRERAQRALAASEQTTRAFQEKLKALNEIGAELAALDTLEAFYRRAIELGTARLGFDRLGLWRLSDDQTHMIGTFGTDEQGHPRDERSIVRPIADNAYIQHMLVHDARVHVWAQRDLLHPATLEPVGTGWNIVAVISTGAVTNGWLAADNLIHQRPLAPYQAELLVLYGATLGYLMAQLESQIALRQSEARYSGLFHGMPVNLYRTTPEGKLLAINPALAQMMGYPDPAAMTHLSAYEFYATPNARDAWRARIEREGMVSGFEVQLRKADESLIWVEDTGHVVRDDQGNALYYEGSLTDITARKRAEYVLGLAMTQVQAQANELATVNEISRQIATILDIDELLWVICDQIKESFDLYYVQIYLLDEPGTNLVLVAGAGDIGRNLVEHRHQIPMDSPRSLVARAAQTRQPVVINDVTQTRDFLPNVFLPATRSELAIPMLVGSDFIGILDIQADAIDWFSESLIATKSTLAVQVAIAINNARLFTASARRLAIIENSTDLIALADMETLTPTYINAAGLAMLGLTDIGEFKQQKLEGFYTPATLRRLRQDILPVVHQAGIWRGESSLLRADGTEIPIEQTILAIGTDTGEPHSLATIITNITERKQAERALQRANRAYQAISECNQAVVRATDEAGLLDDICSIIIETGGYRMAWAGFLQDDDLMSLHPVAQAGHEDGFLQAVVDSLRAGFPEADVLAEAARHNRPIVVADLATNPAYAPVRAAALQRGYHSAIGLPLATEGQLMGMLTVFAGQTDAFDEQEVRLLTELADDLTYGITVMRTRDERRQIFQQLQENEANLSAVIENTDASIWSVNGDLELVTFNTTFRLLFKLYYELDLQPGISIIDALPPHERARWQQFYARALRGEFFRTEQVFNRPDLPAIDLEVSFNPIIAPSRNVTGVTVFSRDITGRKQYEKSLEHLNQQLGERNDELFTLYDIGRKLAATLDPHTIYRLLFDEVVQKRLNAPTFFVSSYDESTQLIACDFGIVDGREIDPTQLDALPLGAGPQSQAIRTRQPHISALPEPHEYDDVPGYFTLFEGEIPPRSGLYVPLISQETITGVLYVQHPETDAFDDTDLNLFSTLANQVAIALQNARLFTAEHQQRLYAETLREIAEAVNKTLDLPEVLTTLFNTIQRVVPYDAVNIMLIDDQGVARVAGFHSKQDHLGLDEWSRTVQFVVAKNGLLNQVCTSGQPLLVNNTRREPDWEVFPDTDWQQAYACAPILQEGQVIGFLNVYSAAPDTFTPEHASYLAAFAYQAGNAIRNAQLFTTVQSHAATFREQATRLAIINRVSGQIAQSLDLDELYAITTRELQVALDVSYVGLVLYLDEEWGYLVMDTHPEQERYAHVPLPLVGNPTIAYLRETHQVITSVDVLNDPLLEPVWDILSERGTHSIMIVPLIVGDEVIGSVGLDSRAERHFTDADRELAETIVNQAALAITKAQLYAAERQQRLLAETLRDTAQTINQTLDPDKVLDRVLENIQRAIPYDAANIMFIEGGEARIARALGYERYGTADQITAVEVAMHLSEGDTRMLQTGQPFARTDTHRDPDWQRYIRVNMWVRSSVHAPITVDEQIIGVLNLDSEQPGTYTQHHAERLQAFAYQAANAIRNARLFTSERQQRALSEALRKTSAAVNSTLDFDQVLRNVLIHIGEVVPHDAATVMLIDDQQDEAYVVGSRGYRRHNLYEWVMRLRFAISDTFNLHYVRETGQPLIVPDTHADPHWVDMPEVRWIRSHATVPISRDDQVIGYLLLESLAPDFFNQGHILPLAAFADQVAVAIQNAHLFTAEHQQRTRAEALRDIANALAGSVHLDHVGQYILEVVARVVPYDAANIMVIDREHGMARVIGSRGYVERGRATEKDDVIVPLDFFIQPGIDHTILVPDTHQHPDWNDLPGDEWIRSYVGAPIRLRRETIGMLNLDSGTPGFYTQEQGEQLRAFTNQIAVAIQTARLFDATQRHAAELEDRVARRTQQLNQQRSQLQAILDSMSEGVIYDEKLAVKYINPALTRLTGYTRDEFPRYLSTLTDGVFAPDDYQALEARIFERVKYRGLWSDELRLRRKDGSEFIAAVTVTRVLNTQGETVGAVTVIRDISQEKALQQQKDRFIANASHELRTPLANIKTRLYLLQKQPHQTGRHLSILNQVSDNMAELVENLLDVSRFERGVIPLHQRELALQSLIEAVTTVQRADAERKGITFDVNLHPTPLMVRADEQRMTQVFTNLVANAINYTNTGGQIAIELLPQTAGDHQPGAVVRVCDTGIGIKPDMLEHVFEPFFRADEQAAIGTGLGLTIAREIVELHGGQISVDSVYNEGSTFTVWLPLVEDNRRTAQQ